MFRHALLHDVAYESLPRGRRARAHAAVGAWLEEIAGDRVDEVADLLAHHYATAVSPGLAELAWRIPRTGSRRAGRLSSTCSGRATRPAERFAIDRAVSLHSRLLQLSVGRDERLQALEALAVDHESNYHGDDAAAMFRDAIELARERPGSARMTSARLCRRLGWMMAWNPGAFRASPDPADVEALVAEGSRAARDPAEQAWFKLVDGATARLYRGSEPFARGHDPTPARSTSGSRPSTRHGPWSRLGRDDLVLGGDQALGMLYGVAGRYCRHGRARAARWQPFGHRIHASTARTQFASSPST